ncbi:MAG: hypothetical protein WDO56_06050 [Gammaproteobacteria bacterium]
MKTPSRQMPKYARPPRRWYMLPFAVAMAGALVYGLVHFIFSLPLLAVPLLAAGAALTFLGAKREKRRKDDLIAERDGESICQFARSFDRHRIDTWVVRAVYEQLQSHLGTQKPLPIRAADSLAHDLRVDDEDLDMVVAEEIFQRTGRSMKHTDRNPYFGKVRTVADLVHFVNEQPKAAR